MPIVTVKNLDFAYNDEKVLENINFTVDEHDFLAVIGPNGGGKSTLLKLILGVLVPQKNDSIRIFGLPPAAEARRRIGYVPQNTNVNLEFPLTVLDVVMMGNRPYHIQNRGWLDRLFPVRYSIQETGCAENTLRQVGMENCIDRRIGELSGGQRQRVIIARALCTHPDILILDEPTSNIDIEGQKQIYTLLKRLNENMTIIVVSHDLSLITQYANKALYVHRKGYFHDLNRDGLSLKEPEGHFCEVELMQMLGRETP